MNQTPSEAQSIQDRLSTLAELTDRQLVQLTDICAVLRKEAKALTELKSKA